MDERKRGQYDEKAKARTMKYMNEKRDRLGLNLPKGASAKYKAFAASQGVSLTALICQLLDDAMEESGFLPDDDK